MFNKIKEFIGLDPSEVYDEYDDVESVSGHTGNVSSPTTYASRPSEIKTPTSSSFSHPELDSSPSIPSSLPMNQPPAMNMNGASNNVVGMPSNRWWGAVAEVVVMEPRNFDEMPQVIQSLKDRKSVVLNLTMMDADEAQRAVDFVAGATFTIDGHQERIGESIFLFTPSCVQVSTQAGIVREVPHPQTHAMQTPSPAWNTATAI